MEVTVTLQKKLDCDVCNPGVLLRIQNPYKLLVNDGQADPALLRYIFEGSITGYTMLTFAQHQYVIEYDEALLTDPLNPLEEEDIREVCCAGCIVDYIREMNLP